MPFGYFKSHFISDPLTLELGETRESAIVIGGENGWLNLCIGAFNGDIDETDDDDHIKSFVASGIFTLPEGSLQGLSLTTGMSWISNIADSDGLQGEDGVDGDAVNDSVDGFSAFISVSLIDRIFLEAEYLGAIDAFEADALAFDGGEAFKPETWNFEIAYAATENLEIGAKYEGSHDCGCSLPEKQMGAWPLINSLKTRLWPLNTCMENLKTTTNKIWQPPSLP
ncbi:MAG: LbtU family siderophore porin [Desulfobacteraceae bacterium]|nr:LbtU family siderophore porin [Desulfobacteraceae bacterium]